MRERHAIWVAVLSPFILGAPLAAQDGAPAPSVFKFRSQPEPLACDKLVPETRRPFSFCRQPHGSASGSGPGGGLADLMTSSDGIYLLEPAKPAAPVPAPAPPSADPPVSAARREEIAAAIAAATRQGYKSGSDVAYIELTQSDLAGALSRAPAQLLSTEHNETAAKVAHNAAKTLLKDSPARRVTFLVAVGAGAYAAYRFIRGDDGAPDAETAPAGEAKPAPPGVWRMQELGHTLLPGLEPANPFSKPRAN